MHKVVPLSILISSLGCSLRPPPIIESDPNQPNAVRINEIASESRHHHVGSSLNKYGKRKGRYSEETSGYVCVWVLDSSGERVGWAGYIPQPEDSAKSIAKGLAEEIQNKFGLAANTSDHGSGIVIMVGNGFQLVPADLETEDFLTPTATIKNPKN